MRALYLAILFGLIFSLVPARALVAADGAAKRRPPKPLGVADKRLESFEDRLRRGEWQAVHAAAHEMVIELVTAGSEDGRLASALRALALAEAGIGRVDEAVWHWQVVQNLKPGLVLDPAAYGEAGALLARHKLRRPGEAPAGLGAVAASDLGAGSTPPRKIAGDDPKIPSSLAASGAPRWARLQVVIDTQGRALEPVVLAGRSEAFQWAALEAVRTWRFEPARREGQPVAVLLERRIGAWFFVKALILSAHPGELRGQPAADLPVESRFSRDGHSNFFEPGAQQACWRRSDTPIPSVRGWT
jgi:TonB family protein